MIIYQKMVKNQESSFYNQCSDHFIINSSRTFFFEVRTFKNIRKKSTENREKIFAVFALVK